jgi:hypothetical protein
VACVTHAGGRADSFALCGGVVRPCAHQIIHQCGRQVAVHAKRRLTRPGWLRSEFSDVVEQLLLAGADAVRSPFLVMS